MIFKKLSMKNVFILLVIVLTSISCSDKAKITEAIKKLQSQPIVLPTDEMKIVRTRDSLFRDFSHAELKLVVYSDSSECTPCAINRMYEWEDIIALDTIYSGRIKFYFIFSPNYKDLRSITRNLKAGVLFYPSFIDKLGFFLKNNPNIPKDRRLHSFLLDKKNNVILVGNPNKNESIKKIFIKEVKKKLNKNIDIL